MGQLWSSSYLMNLDSEKLIQVNPYHVTSKCLYFDKVHIFFELVSGHLILPVFESEGLVSGER